MPRKPRSVPQVRLHISGQGRVFLDGKYHYLGPYGSPEAEARYEKLVGRYLANGRTLPDEIPTHHIDEPVTVGDVMGEYCRLIDQMPTLERYRHLTVLLDDEYGDEPADEFGPRKLADIRILLEGGCSRPTVNEYIRRILLMFKHAVARELIEIEVLARLETLDPLRRGQTKAPEYAKRQPANLEDVRTVAKLLSPQIRAILAIQLQTGMRPSEVFAIRPQDIDRTGAEWFCRLDHHKTEHFGAVKAVPILGSAREAITPFMLRPSDAFCFSPAESIQWYRDQRRAKGTRRDTQKYVPKPNPKRAPGVQFNKDALNRAVVRACEKAGVKRFTPYQLRHTAATTVTDALGIDAARALLGHQSSKMTERYARQRQDETKAIEAARVAPSV